MVKIILDGIFFVGFWDKYYIGKYKVFIVFNDKLMIKIKWKFSLWLEVEIKVNIEFCFLILKIIIFECCEIICFLVVNVYG